MSKRSFPPVRAKGARSARAWSTSALLALVIAMGTGCASESAARKDTPSSSAAPAASVEATAELVGVDASVPEDPEMVALIAPFAETVRERAGRVVGVLKAPLTRGGRDDSESALGNFVTDAMRKQMASAAGVTVDLCFTNRGGLRTDLAAGKVTEGQVVELMPFDNTVVVFPVSGERLNTIIARLAERGDWASGLTYVRRGQAADAVKVGGRPVDPSKTYWVCTNDYVFEGGGGYGLEDVKGPTYTGVLMRDVILAAFEEAQARKAAIEPTLDGRVRVE